MNKLNIPNRFKLIAIRPLKGTSLELLKGLKENCIYQFYNEYTFEVGDDIEIKSIGYTPTVPLNLYGDNISISAIVGQNGSGKSSLLELFYYATLFCNKKHLDANSIKELKSEVNMEIVLLKNDETIQIIKISKEDIKSKFYLSEVDNQVKVYKKAEKKTLNSEEFDFYTNVLNYSIYGLNSNLTPWIDLIFYKNDGYQLPIVINPFKEYGNYDINKEYMLMQSRAIFYSYVLGFKQIIEHIYIHNIYFEIDIIKILNIKNSNESTFGSLQAFLNLNVSEQVYNEIIFDKNTINLISLGVINSFICDVDTVKINKNDYCNIFYNSDLNNLDFYKTLTYLYIFKKIYKISETYKKFKKYHFLFSNRLPFGFNFKDAAAREGIEPNLDREKENNINRDTIYEQIMLELYLDVGENEKNLSEEDLYFIKSSFMSFYAVALNDNISKHLSHLTYDKYNVFNNIDPIKKLVEELFNGKEFRCYLFSIFIQELKEDNSHITFKLKQAINYFKLDIFKSIKTKESRLIQNSNDCKVNISIDKKYFRNRKNIEDIPLAVFTHVLEVVKTKEKRENKRNELIEKNELFAYPYTSLSSGEQHLINSILTIAYHNYNLLSVKDGNELIKYRNINLIFDELELYLHPEYQRVYINNLIIVLRKIQQVTKQNDIYYNILMVTHSPFILSDIPTQNILKLNAGKPAPDNGINSFAANIYDLLKDEFFLKNGAIGEYVSVKIKEVLEKDVIHQEDLDFVNLIGDPFLKGIVKKQIEEKTSIDVLEDEINRLQTVLNRKRSRHAKD